MGEGKGISYDLEALANILQGEVEAVVFRRGSQDIVAKEVLAPTSFHLSQPLFPSPTQSQPSSPLDLPLHPRRPLTDNCFFLFLQEGGLNPKNFMASFLLSFNFICTTFLIDWVSKAPPHLASPG